MACAGSDKRFDLATVELIARIRENRIASRGDCTISYITEQLPGPLFTFARVQAVLSKLKNGMSAAEIAGNYGRGRGRKPSLSSDALDKVIGKVKTNRSNFKNSCREIAKRHGVSRSTASRSVKKAGFSVRKKITTQNFSARSKAKRAQCCAEFQLYPARVQNPLPKETFFFSDECFFRLEPDSLNKQNDRVYVHKEDAPGEAENLLVVPKKQRTKGVGRVRGHRHRCVYRY